MVYICINKYQYRYCLISVILHQSGRSQVKNLGGAIQATQVDEQVGALAPINGKWKALDLLHIS